MEEYVLVRDNIVIALVMYGCEHQNIECFMSVFNENTRNNISALYEKVFNKGKIPAVVKITGTKEELLLRLKLEKVRPFIEKYNASR